MSTHSSRCLIGSGSYRGSGCLEFLGLCIKIDTTCGSFAHDSDSKYTTECLPESKLPYSSDESTKDGESSPGTTFFYGTIKYVSNDANSSSCSSSGDFPDTSTYSSYAFAHDRWCSIS